MKKRFLVLATMMIGSFLRPVDAQFQQRINTFNGYSLIGLHVVQVNFHSYGHSYPGSGEVTDMYFDYWAWFPNSISNTWTWKSYHPYGQFANGSVDIGVGINSPFGMVGISSGRKVFSTLY